MVEDKKIATNLIDQVLAKRPASANAHITKRSILLYGNPDRALPEFDAALEIDPNSPVAHEQRESRLSRRDARTKHSPLFRSLCA